MTFGVIKYVTATSNDLATFWDHKLGQIDHKGHHDLWGHEVGLASSNDPVTFWGHKLGQTDHKGQRDLWGHKVGHGDL